MFYPKSKESCFTRLSEKSLYESECGREVSCLYSLPFSAISLLLNACSVERRSLGLLEEKEKKIPSTVSYLYCVCYLLLSLFLFTLPCLVYIRSFLFYVIYFYLLLFLTLLSRGIVIVLIFDFRFLPDISGVFFLFYKN